jgi:hypothetical protein
MPDAYCKFVRIHFRIREYINKRTGTNGVRETLLQPRRSLRYHKFGIGRVSDISDAATTNNLKNQQCLRMPDHADIILDNTDSDHELVKLTGNEKFLLFKITLLKEMNTMIYKT